MKSFAILLSCLLTIASPGVSQKRPSAVAEKTSASPSALPSAPPEASPRNLTDDFAKSAHRALKKIEAETRDSSKRPDGLSTGQAIDDLDVDAETKVETEVVRVLQVFFDAKINHNMARHIIYQMAENSQIMILTRDRVLPLEIYVRSPTVAKLSDTESACSSELELALRARNYHDVPACTQSALAVKTPDKLDVKVN